MTSQKKRTFPQKLWTLVNDSRLDSAIRWSTDGQSFLVYEHQLRNLCLGKENKNFFTKEPKSFIRQLHLYGFRKLGKNQFKHPKFVRDRPHLITEIKRSYRIIPGTTSEEVANQIEPITPPAPTKMITGYDQTTMSEQPSMIMSSSICSLCTCYGCLYQM